MVNLGHWIHGVVGLWFCFASIRVFRGHYFIVGKSIGRTPAATPSMNWFNA